MITKGQTKKVTRILIVHAYMILCMYMTVQIHSFNNIGGD